MNEFDKQIEEVEKEIKRCSLKKDGDEHFSKENWNLRMQFCTGKLEGLKQSKELANKQLDKFVEKIKEEITNINKDLSVLGRFDNYQKRMMVQVFIDINNQIDKLREEMK